MENDNKKKRNANYSKQEMELLIDLIIEKKNIVENKKSDAVHWQEKHQTWSEIARAMTATTGIDRDVKSVKGKYDQIKKEVRKKNSKIRMNALKTGGGPVEDVSLTPIEEKVKGLILLSVVGMPSTYDSDVITHSDSLLTGLAVTDVEATTSTSGLSPTRNVVLASTSVDARTR
ncbi:nuclear apoptosis-inducing factor 1-like [Onthophagus taurus]|uniref:nuclear apoptosis-inducing factor 1-like n=1 Tax=Onthophagus taurus TaxID=166361 RepID=UPI000C2046F0|nr:uncharacterized protein LOC111415268 [Onthophagus taurus]